MKTGHGTDFRLSGRKKEVRMSEEIIIYGKEH